VIGDGDTMVLPMCLRASRGRSGDGAGDRTGALPNVKAANAMKHVFGYVNFIDGSARDLPPAGTLSTR